MRWLKRRNKKVIAGAAAALLLAGAALASCASGDDDAHREQGEHGSGQNSERGGEHASGEASERGGEGSSVVALAPDETYDETRNGARLILSYDAAANAFTGNVENTTDRVLTRVRVEIHLSNGTELGPTTPTDLAPGQVLEIRLPSTASSFTSWTTHAEIGSGEGGDEHGSGSDGSGS
ncbi:MAG: FxLYD domain-containing protein [Acidimicrobiaceae bacterium]|nr:FxLYD domain-containing protein [Acidimicrobiaceae bacterium]